MADVLDIRCAFPERDHWLYEVESCHMWKPTRGCFSGTRGADICRCEVSGEHGCRRYDKRHPDGLKEKIASDLAQMLELPCPAALLLPPREGSRGVINRTPKAHFQTVADFCLAAQGTGDEGWKQVLSRIYPVEVIAFDCWIHNRDRRFNYRNLLVCESDGKTTVVPIDYNLCFGELDGPWSQDRFESGDFGEHFPVPLFVSLTNGQRRRVLTACDRIEAVERPHISEVVERSARCYGQDRYGALGESIIRGLESRKPKIREWITEKIA